MKSMIVAKETSEAIRANTVQMMTTMVWPSLLVSSSPSPGGRSEVVCGGVGEIVAAGSTTEPSIKLNISCSLIYKN